MPNEKDVHTEHCCVVHGCKYVNDECTVATKQKVQSYDCEYCEWDKAEKKEEIELLQESLDIFNHLLDMDVLPPLYSLPAVKKAHDDIFRYLTSRRFPLTKV